MDFRAQLFKGPLALTQGKILIQVSFSFVQKHYFFLEHPIIKVSTKRFEVNLVSKLSYLN